MKYEYNKLPNIIDTKLSTLEVGSSTADILKDFILEVAEDSFTAGSRSGITWLAKSIKA